MVEWISDSICENKRLTEEVEELRSQVQSRNNKPRINAFAAMMINASLQKKKKSWWSKYWRSRRQKKTYTLQRKYKSKTIPIRCTKWYLCYNVGKRRSHFRWIHDISTSHPQSLTRSYRSRLFTTVRRAILDGARSYPHRLVYLLQHLLHTTWTKDTISLILSKSQNNLEHIHVFLIFYCIVFWWQMHNLACLIIHHSIGFKGRNDHTK